MRIPHMPAPLPEPRSRRRRRKKTSTAGTVPTNLHIGQPIIRSSRSSRSRGQKPAPYKFPSPGALRRYYRQAARTQMFDARRDAREAAHAMAEARSSIAKARLDRRLGYTSAARYYMRKARREEQRARRDNLKARIHKMKARVDQLKARGEWKRARRLQLARPGVVADGWIVGGNDRYGSCTAAALANSLLATRGLRVDDMDVVELYLRGGTTAAGVLEAARTHGLGGVRVASYEHADGSPVDEDGLIAELKLQASQRWQGRDWEWEQTPLWGWHAATTYGGRFVTWGQTFTISELFLAHQVVGMWRVTWET